MPEIIDSRAPREVKEYEEFKPILDRILVRRIDEAKAEGEFVVPEKYRQHSNWGEVIAIGDGVVLGNEFYQFVQPVPPMDMLKDKVIYNFVRPGDMVRYGEYTAEAFSVDDPTLFIVRIQDVRGVRRLIRG